MSFKLHLNFDIPDEYSEHSQRSKIELFIKKILNGTQSNIMLAKSSTSDL